MRKKLLEYSSAHLDTILKNNKVLAPKVYRKTFQKFDKESTRVHEDFASTKTADRPDDYWKSIRDQKKLTKRERNERSLDMYQLETIRYLADHASRFFTATDFARFYKVSEHTINAVLSNQVAGLQTQKLRHELGSSDLLSKFSHHSPEKIVASCETEIKSLVSKIEESTKKKSFSNKNKNIRFLGNPSSTGPHPPGSPPAES